MRTLVVFLVGTFVLPSILAKLEDCHIRAKGNSHFPAGFSFGVSTSAYQIEGGWNADGKGVSIWDDFTHRNPEMMLDGSNGDIAADSYNRFDDDLKILNDLKVGHYRFSISWSRIFPNGETTHKNQPGIDYYNDVIDKLLANGITPIVTMQHNDMPLAIQKRGGFTSPLIIEYFVNFATELFKMFGDRVKYWMTFNEPWRLCKYGYADGITPPLLNDTGVGDYICADNLLKAHGAAYRVYKSKFFEKQGGKIGIAFDAPYFYVANSSDIEIVDRALQYNIGYVAHPIFSKSGGYPEVMVKDIERNSREEGRFMSRLPKLDGEWKEIIRGSADFLGLNYYSSEFLKPASKALHPSPSFDRDLNVEILEKSTECEPKGLEAILHWVRKEYNNPLVIVTENGWRDKGEIQDDNRVAFLKSHVQAVLNAVNGGCNVVGYTHWSLLDNFEWIFGFTQSLGLYAVNRTSPLMERYPKKSALFYKKIIRLRMSPSKIFV